MREALERITGDVLRALSEAQAVPPSGALLLLRRYLRLGDTALRDGLSLALADGIDRCGSDPLWIEPLAEAAAIADDPRVRGAVAALTDALGSGTTHGPASELARDARRLDAALRAAAAIGDPVLLQQAVDGLERIVGTWYEPGRGMADGERIDDQVWTASALASAYGGTERLPYAMLAEELVRFAQRTPAVFEENVGVTLPAALARVLLTLDALHADPDYRQQAIVAPGAEYGRDAARLLEHHASRAGRAGVQASLYAVAVEEYLAAHDLQ